MENKEFMSIPEAAKVLGLSRQAVHKRVKNGKIEAIRIGRNYAIPIKNLIGVVNKSLQDEDKDKIRDIVKRVVEEYGEVLKLLGDG